MNTLDYILNKYKIEVGSQYIVDVPNMGRDDLAKLFAELNFNKGVEVGVERGQFSEVLLKANPNLYLACVDPWSNGAYEPGVSGVDSEQEKFDSYLEETKNRLTPWITEGRCLIIRNYSVQASKDFEDNSLDFVYIDGNHDFPNFINDLHEWKRKVRPGGIISGHDYALFSYKKFNHVKRALDAYARSYRMQPLFIAGRFEVLPGETRDKYRSWFYVKP